jgi:hypothetical protein
MSSARDFKKTVPLLLEIIPEDQTLLREKITYHLQAVNHGLGHKDSWNIAPEIMNGVYFQELGSILNEEIQTIDADWKIKLVKVFNNQE